MSTGIRALTVRQPWAWAIAHGGKNIENRYRNSHHRGPLLIHAGVGWSVRGELDHRVKAAATQVRADSGRQHIAYDRGRIIALVDLADVHPDDGCCKPWGESSYTHIDGRRVGEVWHYVLSTITPLENPIPWGGRLGLWIPPIEIARAAVDQVHAELQP